MALLTTAPPLIDPDILKIAQRFAIADPDRAAGRCEKTADRLRWKLINELEGEEACWPENVKVISGWYRPTKPMNTWAKVWQFGYEERQTHLSGVIDHTWIYLKSISLYVDPTASQFGEGTGGLQIVSRRDPRYLLVHPQSGDKAFHYRPV